MGQVYAYFLDSGVSLLIGGFKTFAFYGLDLLLFTIWTGM